VGERVARVERSADMSRGVVSLPHGWGHDLDGIQLGAARERPGVYLNALLDDAARNPLSGNAVLSGVAVGQRVRRSDRLFPEGPFRMFER